MEYKDKISLAHWMIGKIKNKGANASLHFIESDRLSVQYRNGILEELTESRQNQISIQLFINNRYSSHSTNDMDKRRLELFLEEAILGTSYLSEDKYRLLPPESYHPKIKNTSDLQLIDQESYHHLTLDKQKELAKQVNEAIHVEGGSNLISGTSSSSVFKQIELLLDTNGLELSKEGTMFGLSAEATVNDGDARPEGYYSAWHRFFNQLPPLEEIGKKAAKRAQAKCGQKKVKSGYYTMLVENTAAARLINLLTEPLKAQLLHQKRSFAENMINQQISSAKLSLKDNPHLPSGIGSTYFHGNGIAANPFYIIKEGIISNYFVDFYYGLKLGMEPTAPSSTNLMVEPGVRSLEDIIKDIEQGILVTGFLGGNSNPLTGDFSLGINGLLIENGKAVKAVGEMNITDNQLHFWKKLVEIGSDVFSWSAIARPSLVFEGIKFSGSD